MGFTRFFGFPLSDLTTIKLESCCEPSLFALAGTVRATFFLSLCLGGMSSDMRL